MGNPIEEGGVNVSIKNHIASIEFHHPLSNSLPGKVLQELAKTITEMGNNDEVTVIILKSAGERGSPCRTPLSKLQKPVLIPRFRTQLEGFE